MKRAASALALAAVLAGPALAGDAVMDKNGRVVAVEMDDRFVPVETDIRIPLKSQSKQPGLADAVDVKTARDGEVTTWTGRIEVEPGKFCSFEQSVTEAGGRITMKLTVTAGAEVETEGAYLWLDVPVYAFAGGLSEMFRAGEPAEEDWATMSRYQPLTTHHQTAEKQWTVLRGNTADRIVLTDAGEKTQMDIGLSRSVLVTIRDTRENKGRNYSCRIPISQKLKAGESASMEVTLQVSELPGRGVTNLAVDAESVRYPMDGFGGNYCFDTGTPITQYTFDNLKSAWGRTEMSLEMWVQERGRVTPDRTDWDYLKERDKPNTHLHREFLAARQLQDRGVPYVISVWDIPKWLYEDPERPSYVAKDKWPELAAIIGSYLTYAKRTYGVEPDMFSFNEPNSGVRVKLTPEQHRDQIKFLGAYLESLGLKTKMLLGDIINVGHHTYVRPAADDPEAMRYVRAVAFHSWGRPSWKAYQKWGEVAKELGLPLLVTEAGVDVNAWRDKSHSSSYHYALGELRQYQELVIHSRPQGFMHWEFTRDYGIVRLVPGEKGRSRPEPTPRFFFLKHLCNLTPHQCDVLAAKSDTRNVLITAFAGKSGKDRVYTVHIANFSGGAPRTAKITGIPAGVRSLRAVRSGEKDAFLELPEVTVKDGTAEVELQPESLLTLTTMPPDTAL